MDIAGAILNLTGFRRMPRLRQAEAAECGLACVGMVAGYHGFRTDLAALRREYPISLKGATLADVIEISAKLNLGSRAVRCDLDELPDLRRPAILHWDMNHFVVLKSASRERIVIFDPARGRVEMTLDEADKHFTGVALELTPSSSFRRKRERKPIQLLSLVRLDGPGWKAIAQALLLSLFLQVFVLLTPYYMQLVMD